MQDNESRGHKNLMEIVDEHMKGDVVVKYRNVFDDHNSEEFKYMDKRFKTKLGRISHEPRYRDLMSYYEEIKEEFN